MPPPPPPLLFLHPVLALYYQHHFLHHPSAAAAAVVVDLSSSHVDEVSVLHWNVIQNRKISHRRIGLKFVHQTQLLVPSLRDIVVRLIVDLHLHPVLCLYRVLT
jgi:hypothetical protein